MKLYILYEHTLVVYILTLSETLFIFFDCWSRLSIISLHANLTLPLPNQSSLWKLQKSLWKHIPWMEFIINPFYDYFWYGEALRVFTIRKSTFWITIFFTIGVVYVKMSITPFNVYLCSNLQFLFVNFLSIHWRLKIFFRWGKERS